MIFDVGPHWVSAHPGSDHHVRITLPDGLHPDRRWASCWPSPSGSRGDSTADLHRPVLHSSGRMDSLCSPIATLSVLIYSFCEHAAMTTSRTNWPWPASFVLVVRGS